MAEMVFVCLLAVLFFVFLLFISPEATDFLVFSGPGAWVGIPWHLALCFKAEQIPGELEQAGHSAPRENGSKLDRVSGMDVVSSQWPLPYCSCI